MDNATPVEIEGEPTVKVPFLTMGQLVNGTYCADPDCSPSTPCGQCEDCDDDEVPTPVPCEGCDEYGRVLNEDGLCRTCGLAAERAAEAALYREGPLSYAEDR